jgi:hypothetical protein
MRGSSSASKISEISVPMTVRELVAATPEAML